MGQVSDQIGQVPGSVAKGAQRLDGTINADSHSARGSALLVLQQLSHPIQKILATRRTVAAASEPPDQVGLPRTGHLTIAREGGQDRLVSEVLAPGLEFFGGLAQAFAELS